jgi:hypothetical protein
VPTLNEYADDDGYYIRARPSDAGNVTYQLKPQGARILEKVGYENEDEIDWQVLNALRIPNLLYTGESGTTDNELPVGLDKNVASLSEQKAKRLLSELGSISQVDRAQTDELENILGISTDSILEIDDLVEHIAVEIEKQCVLSASESTEIGGDSSARATLMYDADDVGGEGMEAYPAGPQTDYIITLALDIFEDSTVEPSTDYSGMCTLKIFINSTHGIVSSNARVEAKKLSPETIVEAQDLMNEMLPVAVAEIESVGIRSESAN